MRILINFATRSRPKKFFDCMDNIMELISHENEFEVIVTCDIDDKTMCNDEVRNRATSYKNTKIYYGISKNKVDAINKNVGLSETNWDVLINQSDDFMFLEKDFDKRVCSDMNLYFPDTDGMIHYPDGSPAKDVLCTMSILGRKFYERTNYIYHPDYANVYCDLEATEVGKKLSRYKYIDHQIASHNHPIWAKAEWDEQYRKTEDKEGYARDFATYQRRKKNNFYL